MTDDDMAPGTPFGEELLRIAEEQIEAEHYGVAVVIAQTVIESHIDLAFGTLFHFNVPHSVETMRALLPDRTFMNRATRMLWTDLTYDEIKKADAWKEYDKHVQRRNRVAHGAIMFGRHPSEDLTRADAEASLNAVRNMRAHIDGVISGQIDEIVAARERGEEDQWRALRLLSPRPVESSSVEGEDTT
jgi:hypothetical protein